ncbi:hypothetical protein GCM10007423_16070 [Dyadobacter endophyticus]|uniref:Antitoxin component YwqK of the YwqJK toxin-antitoxin module n=1 Tax=Dyadobacter endophyticus TaxID=1749036 RepID=A0ABQ1YLM6_9BACT|nr:hypothetical protein [Dyadobacter endophyticus]GGH29045.1 hypothetical protein GCM10007423_16070 [Dyadobacter endophyticus]
MNLIRRIPLLLMLLALAGVFTPALSCRCSVFYEGVDSLQQLDEYEFVAHVRITGDAPLKTPDGRLVESTGLLKIEIIERFKGKPATELTEMLKNTSCDMGFDEGEEWIVFAKTSGDRPAVAPCQRNVIYKERNGVSDLQYRRGIRELNDLRRLYGHKPTKPADGLSKTYYPENKLQVEETYSNGMRTGERKVYFLNGKLMGREHYLNDTLNGPSEWYYPSGQLSTRQYFQKGKNHNVSISYHDTTWNSRNPGIKPSTLIWYHVVYDPQGREILSREFSRAGVIVRENINDPETRLSTTIFYSDSGSMTSMQHYRDGQPYGNYQEYDREGNPTKSWDYDANGKQINLHIPK